MSRVKGPQPKSAEREFMGENALCPWCKHRVQSKWYGRKVFISGSNEAKRALRKGRAKIVSHDQNSYRGGTISHDRVVCAHPCHD